MSDNFHIFEKLCDSIKIALKIAQILEAPSALVAYEMIAYKEKKRCISQEFRNWRYIADV